MVSLSDAPIGTFRPNARTEPNPTALTPRINGRIARQTRKGRPFHRKGRPLLFYST